MKLPLTLALLTLTTTTYAQTGPVKVEVRQTNGRYELQRGGQLYFIKGAGRGAVSRTDAGLRGQLAAHLEHQRGR